MEQKLPILFLLGMHRSGTSLLGKICHLLGADFGHSLMAPARDNPTGFYENWRLVEQHDAFMARFATAWDRPSRLPENWLDAPGVVEQFEAIEKLIGREFTAGPVMAVKDPRLAFVYPLWQMLLQSLNRRPCHIVILRHPEEVALSLNQRSEMPLDWAAQLYRDYNTAIRDIVLDDTRTFWVSYEQIINGPGIVARRLAKHFESEFGVCDDDRLQAATEAAEPDLRHQQRSRRSVTRFGEAFDAIPSLPGEGITGEALSAFFEVLDRSRASDFRDFLRLERPQKASAGTRTPLASLIPQATAPSGAGGGATTNVSIMADFKDPSERMLAIQRESFDAQISLLKHELFDARAELRKLRETSDAKLAVLHDAMGEATSSRRAIAEVLESTRRAETDLNSRILALSEERLTLLRSLDETRGARDAAADQLATLTAERDRLSSRVADLERDAAATLAKLQEAQGLGANLERLLEEASSDRERLRQSETELNTAMAALNAKADYIYSELGKAKSERDALSAQLQALAGERDGLSEHVAQLLGERNRLREVEHALASRDGEFQSLTSERVDLSSRIDALLAERDGLAEHVAELLGHSARMRDIEVALGEREAELAALGDELGRLKADRIALERSLAAAKQRIGDLEAARTEAAEHYDAEIARLKSQLEQARQRAEELAATLDEARVSLTSRDKALAGMEQRLQSVEQAAASAAESYEARIKASDDNWGRYAETLQERAAREQENARSELQRVQLESTLTARRLQAQVEQMETSNNELRRQIDMLHHQITSVQQRPLRTGVKSLAWGVMRAGYHGLPMSRERKTALVQRLLPRIARISPTNLQVTAAAAALASGEHLDTRPAPVPGDVEQAIAGISFPHVEKPDISIIVPVYNQVAYTLACLRSLMMQTCSDTFEAIVMDDGSSDETEHLLPRIPGLRYVRNPENLAFIGNCNAGARHARGDYLVFLNNDTKAMPGWLKALRDTFREHGNVGIAGSKLIFADGRLQEAGGIIWEDASGWNWGRLQDPRHPRYNFVRDVDYVSGAALMVPHKLFFELGCFSSELEKAYYEDTYLAFAARAAGYRVLYQPASELIHYEGVSAGTDETKGMKRYQVVNRDRFFERWKGALATHLPNASNPERASDRMPIGHVLIIDATTPTPDKDSGSIDMVNLIRILVSQRYRVHFIPQTNFAHFGRYTEQLQAKGVECIYAPYYTSVDQYLAERGEIFSHVILARLPVAEAAIADVEKHAPRAAKIFYTVDMHGLRSEREAELKGDRDAILAARQLVAAEQRMIRRTDLTVVLSVFEEKMLREQGFTNIEVLPLLRDVPGSGPKGFDARRDVVFIGGFQHTPNGDAVRWLIDEIWPRVRKLAATRGIASPKLRIVGSQMPDWVRAASGDDIEAVGYVADLEPVFHEARLSIAPLRYGAGLKGKIATSLGYGVPAIGTGIAFEGMPGAGLDEVTLRGDTPDELARLVVEMMSDAARWDRVARAGVRYAEQHFSTATLVPQVVRILERSTGTHALPVAAQ